MKNIFKKIIKLNWKARRYWFILALTAFVLYGVSTISANADSPKADLSQPTVVTPTPTSEQQQIHDYIVEVFGKDAPKAFQLLQDPRCHENGSLNPSAVNDNAAWGGRGQDIGVFQINNSWQQVQDKFLYNWHINIQIAHQLYVENGNHFNLWTCGKYLHI